MLPRPEVQRGQREDAVWSIWDDIGIGAFPLGCSGQSAVMGRQSFLWMDAPLISNRMLTATGLVAVVAR